MAQSLSRVYVHIVFSTKNRVACLVDAVLRKSLHARLASLCGSNGSPALQVGGAENHVHMLCALGRTTSIAQLVKEVKRGSSKWLKSQSRPFVGFYWQDGYGSFSVSPSHVPALETYIKNQMEHHRDESFEVEYLRLLEKYEIEYDEKYLWD